MWSVVEFIYACSRRVNDTGSIAVKLVVKFKQIRPCLALMSWAGTLTALTVCYSHSYWVREHFLEKKKKNSKNNKNRIINVFLVATMWPWNTLPLQRMPGTRKTVKYSCCWHHHHSGLPLKPSSSKDAFSRVSAGIWERSVILILRAILL